MAETAEHKEPQPAHDAEQAERALDSWRARIDELLVQLDLARMDARQEIRSRLDRVENVYLAARSQLSEARSDAGSSVSSVRRGLDDVLRDLQLAYEDAVEALRRGRQEPPS